MRVEPSWRQPAGIALILLLIIGWAVLVVSLAPLLDGLPRWVHAVYYVIGGLVWIMPLRPLLRWMETGKWRE
jgi:predicted membrane channel-forming protein YqfA (hemolysin III family)